MFQRTISLSDCFNYDLLLLEFVCVCVFDLASVYICWQRAAHPTRRDVSSSGGSLQTSVSYENVSAAASSSTDAGGGALQHVHIAAAYGVLPLAIPGGIGERLLRGARAVEPDRVRGGGQ